MYCNNKPLAINWQSPQSQAAANPWYQGEEKKDKN